MTTSRVVELADGTRVLRTLHGHERPHTFLGSHCPQCGTRRGHNHAPGCPLEQCPRCRGTLTDCGCLTRTGGTPLRAGNTSAKGCPSDLGHPRDGFWDGVS